MDATQPFVDRSGKPTRFLIARINALRLNPTDPSLNANTAVVDAKLRPTRTLIALLVRLVGTAPNANVAIVDEHGIPTKPFLELVNA